jgi:hypothetical protein
VYDQSTYAKMLDAARRETAPHDGQCEGCSAWRLDGQPPTVHRHLCPFGPDGRQLDPLTAPEPASHARTPSRASDRRSDRAALVRQHRKRQRGA